MDVQRLLFGLRCCRGLCRGRLEQLLGGVDLLLRVRVEHLKINDHFLLKNKVGRDTFPQFSDGSEAMYGVVVRGGVGWLGKGLQRSHHE